MVLIGPNTIQESEVCTILFVYIIVFVIYDIIIKGVCNNFVPNGGFWCNRGYTVPGGLVYNDTILPNAPYANITGAIIQTWRPNHWYDIHIIYC